MTDQALHCREAMTLEQVRDLLRFSASENVNMDALREQMADAIDEHLNTRAQEAERTVKESLTVATPPDGGEAGARRFHEAYERLAPSFGYETRAETRQFDPSSPNGRLMIAVCSEIYTRSNAQGGEVTQAMIERAARALSLDKDGCDVWDKMGEAARDCWRHDARIAINAALPTQRGEKG